MPLRYYSWEKRAIRKNDDTDEDEDRKLAETIAADTLPGRPLEQKELAAWLLAKPSRLRQLQRNRETAQRASFELRSTRKGLHHDDQRNIDRQARCCRPRHAYLQERRRRS